MSRRAIHQRECRFLRLHRGEVNQLQARLFGQRTCKLRLTREARLHGHLPEEPAALLLLGECLLNLTLLHNTLCFENLSQQTAAFRLLGIACHRRVSKSLSS